MALVVWSTPDGVPWNSCSISQATAATSDAVALRPAACSSTRAHATDSAPELPPIVALEVAPVTGAGLSIGLTKDPIA